MDFELEDLPVIFITTSFDVPVGIGVGGMITTSSSMDSGTSKATINRAKISCWLFSMASSLDD